jgi:hypothetical protein
MQSEPTARHSLIGPFQRVCYLVHAVARTHPSIGGIDLTGAGGASGKGQARLCCKPNMTSAGASVAPRRAAHRPQDPRVNQGFGATRGKPSTPLSDRRAGPTGQPAGSAC